MFTRAQHWLLRSARWVQSTSSHTISLRSILTSSSYLRLCLAISLFPLGFPTKIFYSFLTSWCLLHAPPPNLILLDLIILKISGKEYKLWSFSVPRQLIPLGSRYSSQQRPVLERSQYVFFPLDEDQVSHPYNTTGKVTVLYIWIVMLLDSKR
jgi:hypothetical protein